MRLKTWAALVGFAASIPLLCATGCAVALAPGYQIVKETREIHFVPGETPALAIRVDFTLLNSGTSELNFVDVRIPSAAGMARSDFRVEVDGHEVAPGSFPSAEPQAHPDVVRVPFEAPWKRKEKRALSFEYTLRSSANSASDVTIDPASFHLGLGGWAPQLQPPKYLLATFPSRPARMTCEIRVPSDFAVLAGGVRKGQKNYGDEIEYRYELRSANLGVFAVAGRYVKWPPANGKRNSAAFWTLRPLAGNVGQSADQIAEIWKTLTTDFGVLDEGIRAPHVVESASVQSKVTGEAGPASVSFPGGALLNPAAFQLGIDSERFFRIISEALARNWFDEEVSPSNEAEIGMGEGLPEYASIVADEARTGPVARRQRIYEYLRRYDAAVKGADEMSIAATTAHSPLPQRQIAIAKAPLFYIDIEDTCGEAPVRAGLARMLATMRGQEVDYNVLRSVLEESTGRELGKIFREWLGQKGIPETFRARYRYGEGAGEMGH